MQRYEISLSSYKEEFTLWELAMAGIFLKNNQRYCGSCETAGGEGIECLKFI